MVQTQTNWMMIGIAHGVDAQRERDRFARCLH